MNRIAWMVAAAALVSVACGRHTGQAQLSDTGLQQAGAKGPQLRLLGVNPGPIASARMRIEAVQVRAGTKVLARGVSTPEVELAETKQAWLLTTFQVPAGVEEVQVSVAFRSGTFDAARQSGDVDVSCATIEVPVKVSLLAPRNHAVIQLDLARSLVAAGGQMKLVPQVQMQY